MRDKIEELLDMSDPMTKSHYMIWDSGDCSEVGLCEILLDQLIRKHKKDNGIIEKDNNFVFKCFSFKIFLNIKNSFNFIYL